MIDQNLLKSDLQKLYSSILLLLKFDKSRNKIQLIFHLTFYIFKTLKTLKTVSNFAA